MLLLLFELTTPVSFLISLPFAQLICILIQMSGLVSEGAVWLEGSSLVVRGAVVDFSDLCTVVPQIILTTLFLWLGQFSPLTILFISSTLIVVNVLRSIAVATLLANRGYSSAMAVHNTSSILFTIGLAVLMLVGVYRSGSVPRLNNALRRGVGKTTMKLWTKLHRKRAVSTLMATVLIITIVLGLALVVASMTWGWFRGTGGAVLDVSQTRTYLDPSTGKGKIHIHIANTGTGSAQIRSINITAESAIQIVFDASDADSSKWKPKTYAPSGKVDSVAVLVGSSASVGLTKIGTSNYAALNLPSTSHVDIVIEYNSATKAENLDGVVKLGSTYRGTVWPVAGTGVSPTDFTVRIEPLVP